MDTIISIAKSVKNLISFRVLNGKNGNVRVLIGKKLPVKSSNSTVDWGEVFCDNIHTFNGVDHTDGAWTNGAIGIAAELINAFLENPELTKYGSLTVLEAVNYLRKYGVYKNNYSNANHSSYCYGNVYPAMRKLCKLAKRKWNGRILVSMPV